MGRLEQAAGDNPHAAGFLAEVHLSGTGTRRDLQLAARFARSAADGGDSGGMRVLGQLYQDGLGGLPKDPAKSVEWWQRAAGLGETYSMYFLAFPYLKGEGVPRDIPQGLEWLERAGHAGNPWAIKYLGDLYETGWSVIRPDPDKVLYWREKAAAAGDKAAQGWLKFRELTGEE